MLEITNVNKTDLNVNIEDHILKYGVPRHIYYYQNEKDIRHLHKHAIPFIKFIKKHCIQKTQHQSFVFKIDALYSLIIMIVVPILYLLGGDKLIIISFLVSSIIAHIVYKFTYDKFLK